MINNRIIHLICRIRNSLNRDGFIISTFDTQFSTEILDLLAKLGSLGLVKYLPLSSSWYLTGSSLSQSFLLGHIRHISTSGRRIYRPWYLIKEGEIIRSSKGYLTREEAFKFRIGGELILKYSLNNIH